MDAEWTDPPSTAKLYSPEVHETNCFRFWYYMFGEKTPQLSVVDDVDGTLRQPLFEKSGSQGDFWHAAVIDINYPLYYVSIVILSSTFLICLSLIAHNILALTSCCSAKYY